MVAVVVESIPGDSSGYMSEGTMRLDSAKAMRHSVAQPPTGAPDECDGLPAGEAAEATASEATRKNLHEWAEQVFAGRESRSEADPSAVASRPDSTAEVAFAKLYRELAPNVNAFLRARLKAGATPDVIGELSHETWIETWRSLRAGRFRPQVAKFTTYLLGIAYKVWLRHQRRSAIEGRRRGELETHVRGSGNEFAVDDEGHLIDLCTTLEGLRDCIRRARQRSEITEIDLRVLQGLVDGTSERDLALELDVAPSTVNARKQAALGRLRRCLARKGLSGRIDR